MLINKQTTILSLIEDQPYMLEELIRINKGFDKLRNPLFRNTMARVASIETAAGFMGMDAEEALEKIRQAVLANIIQELHHATPSQGSGATPPPEALARAKTRFEALAADLAASDIAAMEQALMENGMPASEIQGLCTVHAAILKPDNPASPPIPLPPGHPLELFRRENQAILDNCERLDSLVSQAARSSCEASSCEGCSTSPEKETYLLDLERLVFLRPDLQRALDWLVQIDLHYQRKELELFPKLEARGVQGPSKVMWGVDDKIRAMLKGLRLALAENRPQEFAETIAPFLKEVRDMVRKEEQILFPLALEQLDAKDWMALADGEAALGTAFGLGTDPHREQWLAGTRESAMVTSATHLGKPGTEPAKASDLASFAIPLATGSLDLESLRAILCLLPVDISFVDADDRVQFYSDNPDRVFPRSPSVIGRQVQFCHPPKSLHLVQAILDDFRQDRRRHAEFWIQLGGRFIHIQYFAVHNAEGRYLGCLEASQDLTRLRELEGEKRL